MKHKSFLENYGAVYLVAIIKEPSILVQALAIHQVKSLD